MIEKLRKYGFFQENIGLLQVLVFLSGFLLIFGSTNISLFEILAVTIGLGTLIDMFKGNGWVWLVKDGRNNYLLAFSALTLFLMFLEPQDEYLFAVITLYLVGVYFLVRYWSRKNKHVVKLLTGGYVTAALVSAVLGTLAYFRRVLFEPESNLFFWGDDVRMTVLYDDPVVYGAFLVPAIMVLLYWFFKEEKIKNLLWISAGIFFLHINLLVSGSRGAWLNAFFAALTLLILSKDLFSKRFWLKNILFAVAGLIIGILIIFIIPINGKSFYKSTLSARISSPDLRIENFKKTPELLLDRDLGNIMFGSGSGSFEKYSKDNISAHNLYLRIIFEQGFVGILLMLLFLFTALRSLWKSDSINQDRKIILMSVVFGILIQSLFVDTLHWRHFWVILGLI